MKRTNRAELAKETVAICYTGSYMAPNGTHMAIGSELAKAKAGTVLYSPENPPIARKTASKWTTHFDVRNETTFQALARLASSDTRHLACLNFASAKNPGGGFLNGALAQEEALCCASALYPCLLEAPEYYERNRANRSALYLDLAIFSPRVPFFRDDGGNLQAKVIMASVITAPAPNAGAIAMNEPANSQHIVPVLKRRTELVLHIAQAHEVDILVLGAWGCGVFRNSPRVVAHVFAELLTTPGKFAGTFREVVFAVFDRSEDEATYRAFADRFNVKI